MTLVLLAFLSCIHRPPAAAAPSGVPAGWSDARAALSSEAHRLVADIDADATDAVYARFSEPMKTAVPRSSIADILASLPALGQPTGETVIPLGPDARIYVADYEAGLTLSAVLDASGLVLSLLFSPRTELEPDPHAADEARLRFPLSGPWLVMWGGDSARENYHVVAPAQRHAVDLLVWRDGSTHGGPAREEHYAWDQPVTSPVSGTVYAVVEGLDDQAIGASDPRNAAGNHVVIEMAPDRYLFVAHLQRGTLVPLQGQPIEAGALLGHTGNSGNTSEPHLHLHVQDRPNLLDPEARGVPMVFDDLTVDGVAAPAGALRQGTFVAPR